VSSSFPALKVIKKYRINGGVVIKQSNMSHAVVEKDGGRYAPTYTHMNI
jgi:hypothetical protein